jgi:hypothetical protein
MPKVVSRQETDPAICGRCGGMGYVRGSVRYCSGCGKMTVGCTCAGDRPQSTSTDLENLRRSLEAIQ